MRKKPRLIRWKRTLKGKVIYERKTHYIQTKDLTRMAINLTNYFASVALGHINETPDRPGGYRSDIQIFGLFQVVRDGLYPWYLGSVYLQTRRQIDSMGVPGSNSDQYRRLGRALDAALKKVWKKATYDLCEEIGKEMKIPKWIRNLVLKNFFNLIWATVWKLTDPLFNGR